MSIYILLNGRYFILFNKLSVYIGISYNIDIQMFTSSRSAITFSPFRQLLHDKVTDVRVRD